MPKLPLISFLLLCLACSRPRDTSRGFYFWKQRYQPDSSSLHALKTLATQKLYVKMFDVTRDPATGKPIPVAKLDQRSSFPQNVQIIPTVFIVNDVWQQADPGILARQVASLLEQLCSSSNSGTMEPDRRSPSLQTIHNPMSVSNTGNVPKPASGNRSSQTPPSGAGNDSMPASDNTSESTTPDAQPGTENNPVPTIPEIQIDCDWTRTTKETYFAFLEALRLQPFLKDKQLSVTIRLHQVKYLAGSGVPPADKGLLMCYNMGNLRKYGDHNSILNMDDIKAYTARDRIGHYPLSLDLALPIFEWSVLFRRQTYAGLLRNLDAADLANSRIFRKDGTQLYTIIKDTLVKGYPLRAGEEIRHETCSPALLKKAARYLSNQRQDYDPVIVLYHLDANTLQRYDLADLETIYDILR